MSDVSAVTAAELMSSPVIAVTTEHSLAAAWEAMRSRRLHHLVVLDQYGLAAVVDDRTMAAHWPPGGLPAPHSITIGVLATRAPRCVLPDQPAAEVARIMVEERCDAVPVVTSAGILLGLITSSDLVAAVASGSVPVVSVIGSREHGERD